MPIKPENRHLYPPGWKTFLRPMILDRAGNRCEGSPLYPDCRAENGKPHPVTGSKVVLTVAHMNGYHSHAPENLRALCQRCHLAHDLAQRARTASALAHSPAVCDAATGTLRCQTCGDTVPIPLGVSSWCWPVMQAFARAHRDCDGRPGKTRFSAPRRPECGTCQP